MPEPKMFVLLIEVCPTVGCQLDPEEVAGASVRCYASADSEAEALSKLKVSLLELCLSLVEIEWCVQDDQVEWEHADDPVAETLMEEAKQSSGVAFGEFHTWGHEAPDA